MSETGCVLVCVTVQKECGRLIRFGREIATREGLPLHVLHVCSAKTTMLGNPDAAEALDYLFSLAHQADAEMNILYDEADAAAAIARYARHHGARQVVMGKDQSGFGLRLRGQLPRGTELISPHGNE